MFKRIICILSLLVVCDQAHAMMGFTYDNRFFPYGPYDYSRRYEKYSNALPGWFVVLSDSSYNFEHEEQPLFNVYGFYDLNQIAQALVAVGQPNPLKTEWQGSTIPYRMEGKLEALGLSMGFNHDVTKYITLGAGIYFMNVKSWLNLELIQSGLIGLTISGPGDVEDLIQSRLTATSELGITELVSNVSGFSDLDAYIRFGNLWDYPYRFKRIDAGLKIGVLFPTGTRRNINNPASVPFGGDGRYGMYVSGEVEFELKEDMKFGLWFRVIKRFSRTLEARVPALNEPINFGAITGRFNVRPKVAFVLYPYFRLEDIRDGLGAEISYLLVSKLSDTWIDRRVDQSVPANLEFVREQSAWTAEHISVSMFYDFGKRVEVREFAPILALYVDVPLKGLGPKRSSKSFRISMSVECNF